MPRTKPISYLKEHAEEISRTIRETGEPLVITEDGEKTLIVQDFKSHVELENALAMLKMLSIADRQIAEGKVTPLEDVIARFEAKKVAEG
ncbi:type II toxin-antitoxin system Phd/YefM family antitoxin [bacterium]|nr:type II toxin-antitoxin system Phd/YefM family antitoxin [bacterium]